MFFLFVFILLYFHFGFVFMLLNQQPLKDFLMLCVHRCQNFQSVISFCLQVAVINIRCVFKDQFLFFTLLTACPLQFQAVRKQQGCKIR